MFLDELVLRDETYGNSDVPHVDIDNIVIDSRKAVEGSMFVCMKGSFQDGHMFAYKAYLNGCRCFLCQNEIILPEDATVVRVEDSRAMLAKLSCRFFKDPSHSMKIIGITGTKGKTTISLMITDLMNSCGLRCGYIGSNGIFFNNTWYKTENTTPESLVLQKTFRDMLDSGIEYVALEVSSQALHTHRVDGVRFDTVVFTNLARDHIGKYEHPDFDHYIECKASLFTDKYEAKNCYCNVDDTMTSRVTRKFKHTKTGYSMRGNGDINSDNIRYYRTNDEIGVMFDISFEGKKYQAIIPMPGDFNVSNATCAFSVCTKYIVDRQKIIDNMAKLHVGGRFEILHSGKGVTFVIDYAHNGLSLSCALEELRKFCDGKLICLFGSVGDRTKERREELGRAAGFYADYCIVTSDNPGNEDPMNIISDILYHIKLEKCPYRSFVDRKDAITYAYQMAEKGDIVLLAGKGHESYQLIEGVKHPFSERKILEELISSEKKVGKM